MPYDNLLMMLIFSCSYLDSVRPNLFAKIIAVLSILRLFCIIYPGLNIIIENEFLCTEGIHVIVFLIGMFLAIECFLSILNFLFGLRLLKLRMDWWIPKLSFYSIFILISMSFSVLNAVLLFQMVRSVWTQYFAYFIQILHCVPTALLIAQTLIQGTVYIYSLFQDKELLISDFSLKDQVNFDIICFCGERIR